MFILYYKLCAAEPEKPSFVFWIFAQRRNESHNFNGSFELLERLKGVKETFGRLAILNSDELKKTYYPHEEAWLLRLLQDRKYP